jgi:hypothetical protein
MGPASAAGPTLPHQHTNFRHNSSVRAPGLLNVAVCVLACAVVAGTDAAQVGPLVAPTLRSAVGWNPGWPEGQRYRSSAHARRITWDDAAPLRARLEKQGITQTAFPSYVERLRENHVSRMRKGDLDHLIFYLLQSTQFTPLPAIEPALSAKALVQSLDPADRDGFLRGAAAREPSVPAPVRARIAALIDTLDSSSRDPRPFDSAQGRLAYFRALVQATFPDRRQREAAMLREYLRAMRFIYQKEFVAQPAGAAAVAELYRARGLSTDTAVEAGYVVHTGLGIIRALDPDRRIRRVLIVGPGLDLAPRTGLVEAGPPESYQPWAVIDALLSLGLSLANDLHVVGADINPRVVDHLTGSRVNPPVLTLVSEIRESDTVTFSADYREYFTQLGRAVADGDPARGEAATLTQGHLRKTVRVGRTAAATLAATTLDIVTERLDAPAFDLIVATNILPYFDDVELMLAMSNIAGMLGPGGIFLHNEPRPVLGDITDALRLPFDQSRHVVIASVRGAPAPLYDSVWVHRKK